jgi:hypothetical protein
MENIQAEYYYTEKLIDCFLTETVPVYWGCPSISQIFDPRGMLMFQDWHDLSELLPSLTWQRFSEMRPFVLKNQQIALDLKLTDYRGHYTRLAEILGREIPSTITPVAAWRRTKLTAICRMIAERRSWFTRRIDHDRFREPA